MQISVSVGLMNAALPVVFFNEMNKISGSKANYYNPGVSLRSFIIANMNSTFIKLTDEARDVFEECHHFSNDALPRVVAFVIGKCVECKSTISNFEKEQPQKHKQFWLKAVHGVDRIIQDLSESMVIMNEEFIHKLITANNFIDETNGIYFKNQIPDTPTSA